MPLNTLTLALEGDVSLREFSEAMQHFHDLVKGLSQEIAGSVRIDWAIEDLEAGSAVAVVRGTSEQPQVVARVVSAYATIGHALASGDPIPYSETVSRYAQAITRVLNGRISSIRFQTETDEAIIASPSATQAARGLDYALGSVKGKVQMLTERTRLKFTLYDAIFDRAVTCYLSEDQRDVMREAWGKRAIVSGRVGRRPDTGHPVVIREIKSVTILEPPEPGGFESARGILAAGSSGETAEQRVGRMRDAWSAKLRILGQ